MKHLTTAEHLRNAEIALFYWKTVPRKNVIYGLRAYLKERLYEYQNKPDGPLHTCGTVACFGGWVPAMPEFAAMGVTAQPLGSPRIIKGAICFEGSGVAGYLFGKRSLFHARGDCEYDQCITGFSDHRLVTNRLEKHIERLKARMEVKAA